MSTEKSGGTMGCEALKELVPLHVLGLLGPEEAAPLRRHLDAGCPRCAAELAATRVAIDALPHALPADDPSPTVKARLMASIRKEPAAVAPASAQAPAPMPAPVPAKVPAPAPARRPRTMAWAAAASIVAALVGVALGGRVASRRADIALAALRGQIERQNEELAALHQQIRAAQDSIRLVSAPGVVVADLAGQGDRATAAARVFWDRQGDRWQLSTANLPPAGPGKTYQLWLITATAKISAGTFEATGELVTGAVRLPEGSGPVVAAAVTDEPAGGSPQPTGTILLLGKI